MRGIVDRFEGDYAVIELENMKMRAIKKESLPQGAKEGSAIVFTDGKWQLDEKRTISLEKEIQDLANELFE
ncbi:MAG: DUF3006 domain-containing protein [Desulfitobacteriia bacterium]|jgi:hypothetical protein